jgi:alkylated DNA repair dioxygenase AlkB
MASKTCPGGKILNPETGRCVKIDGKIGREITKLHKSCPDGKILNPETGRCVKIDGKIGRKIAQKGVKTKKKVTKEFKQGKAEIDIYENFYDKSEANRIFDQLLKLGFEDSYVKIYGKKRMPRKMLWFSDNKDWTYVFSKNHIGGLKAHKFTKLLNKIRQKVETQTGKRFNSLLINLYESGSDSVNWHSDDDPWLGDSFMVPSLSFGAERFFAIKENKKGAKGEKMLLKNGSMIVMKEMTQKSHVHSVPKTKQKMGPRVNLTFRNVVPSLVSKQPKPAT